jgi:indole-3-glycerol phosphate synthase
VLEGAARAAALRHRRAELEARAARTARRPSMAAALRRADVAVIAEVKRASPSRGTIRAEIDAGAQAAAYAAGGAAAISVLTESSRFGGTLSDLENASGAVAIPLLRKDFIVSEEQILEALVAGASAVLLIVRALEPPRLRALTDFCAAAGLESLVEVHDEGELAIALSTSAGMIGVNARNLETLAVNPGPVPTLLAKVPQDRVCIAESGLITRDDVAAVAEAGADAVLVGSAVSLASDPAAAVRSLTGLPRKARAARN